MSSFISLQTPPREAVSSYDPHKRHNEQPAGIPTVFLDAMSVREAVYVDEQKVPLEYEFDSDDQKSYHWVCYASVGAASTGGGSGKLESKGEEVDGTSSGGKMALGTIRLVLPPHEHDAEGHNEGPNMDGVRDEKEAEEKGCLRRGNEPYVKIGRLALLKEYRKMGLSRLLLQAAESHATKYLYGDMPALSPMEAEQKRIDSGGVEVDDDAPGWQGLILVHAQSGIEKLWRAWGFTRDHSMGEWDEEGIMHVGMWKRIDVDRRRASLVGPIDP